MVSVDNVNVKRPGAGKPAGPVAQMIADANRIEYETDVTGRRIGVRKLTFLDTHRITCIMGEDARNESALNQALVVASVADIDGDSVSRPVSLAQVHALMARLDFPGVTAAAEALAKFSPAPGDGQEGEKTAIKNS